jgi:hypothetical protein
MLLIGEQRGEDGTPRGRRRRHIFGAQGATHLITTTHFVRFANFCHLIFTSYIQSSMYICSAINICAMELPGAQAEDEWKSDCVVSDLRNTAQLSPRGSLL